MFSLPKVLLMFWLIFKGLLYDNNDQINILFKNINKKELIMKDINVRIFYTIKLNFIKMNIFY